MEDAGGQEEDGSEGGADNTQPEDDEPKDGADKHEVENENENEDEESIPATMVEEHSDERETALEDHEVFGVIDTVLMVVVRSVLASVWMAVVLRWVLERVSDVLALLIELGLAWIPHRDERAA